MIREPFETFRHKTAKLYVYSFLYVIPSGRARRRQLNFFAIIHGSKQALLRDITYKYAACVEQFAMPFSPEHTTYVRLSVFAPHAYRK